MNFSFLQTFTQKMVVFAIKKSLREKTKETFCGQCIYITIKMLVHIYVNKRLSSPRVVCYVSHFIDK